MDTTEQSVRDYIRADREANGLTWARLAGELGVPVSQLFDFCAAKTQLPPSVRFRRALWNTYPALRPHLERIALEFTITEETTMAPPPPRA